MWDLYQNLIVFGLFGIMGTGYYFKDNKQFLQWLAIAFVLLIISLCYIHEQVTFAAVHNNDMLFKQIDQMTLNDLKNKMKMCVLDKNNCQFISVEQ